MKIPGGRTVLRGCLLSIRAVRSARVVFDELVHHLGDGLVDRLRLLLDVGGDIRDVVAAVVLEPVAVAVEVVDGHGIEDPVVDDDVQHLAGFLVPGVLGLQGLLDVLGIFYSRSFRHAFKRAPKQSLPLQPTNLGKKRENCASIQAKKRSVTLSYVKNDA